LEFRYYGQRNAGRRAAIYGSALSKSKSILISFYANGLLIAVLEIGSVFDYYQRIATVEERAQILRTFERLLARLFSQGSS